MLKRAGLVCIGFIATALFAQTNVTTPGDTTNSIPVFTGSASVGSSVITQVGGNIGIGTATPDQAFTVNGKISMDLNAGGAVYLRDATTSSGRDVNIDPRLLHEGIISGDGSSATGWGLHIAAIPWTWGQDPIYYHAGTHIFLTALPNAAETEVMRLTGNGNLGIGTTGPGAKLEVNGNIKLTSGSGASLMFADGTVQSTAWTGSRLHAQLEAADLADLDLRRQAHPTV